MVVVVVVVVADSWACTHAHAIDLGISLLIVFAFGGGPVLSLLSLLSLPLSIQYIALGIVNILTELPRKPNRPTDR